MEDDNNTYDEERAKEEKHKDTIAAYNAVVSLQWGINAPTNDNVDTAGDANDVNEEGWLCDYMLIYWRCSRINFIS